MSARRAAGFVEKVGMGTVNYVAAARRHLDDGRYLLVAQRPANAGQLFGFSVECGLKALLIACGVTPDAQGELPRKSGFRTHQPMLSDNVVSSGHLIPDGVRATCYMAMLSSLTPVNAMADWSTDHRYWDAPSIPLTSIPGWEQAATEANAMLDQAVLDGVIR